MRFDEFVKHHSIAFSAVNWFDGFVVEVEGPPGWEHFDSAIGGRIWICRSDPYIDEFCANAVQTMHRVAAHIGAADVFAMLAEQQLQSLPACHELRRELAPATEGPGAVGTLAIQINHELGTLDSTSQTRIITTDKETLIAQLTVTALHNSPVDYENVWLSVRLDNTPKTAGAAGPAAPGGHGCAPVTGPRKAL